MLFLCCRNNCSPNAELKLTCKEKTNITASPVKKFLLKMFFSQLIKKAETWAIRSPCEGNYLQIVLCTCSTAGSKRVKDACNNVVQCIVDECGMCMEPETLIPIVSSKAQQVVLIGDHMQLQPIVKNSVARSLGLRTSMFERFSDSAFMLEEQYRMVSRGSLHFFELTISGINKAYLPKLANKKRLSIALIANNEKVVPECQLQ